MTEFYQHHTLSQEHYVSILKRLIPDIAIKSIEKIHGYDSIVLIVNHERLFKFPQRPDVFEQYAREISVFPLFKKTCSFAIPNIVAQWGTMGELDNFVLEYTIMPGDHLTHELKKHIFDETYLEHIGKQIGEYLGGLHALSTAEAKNFGVPDFNPTYWQEQYDFVRKNCFLFFNAAQQEWVSDLYEQFLTIWNQRTFRPTFIHGDMGNWHIFAEGKNIIGFIDWGGMKIDDPARDILWHEKQDTVDQQLGRIILTAYENVHPLDTTFFERTSFYKKRTPLGKFIKGVQFDDEQRIADGYKLLEEAMKKSS